MTLKDNADGPGTGTVSRAVHLLALLADQSGGLSVKRAGDELGVPPSTAHRLLNLLRGEGFVDVVAPGHYTVGSRFYRIAARIVQNVSPQSLAQPIIEELASRFNETVLFALHVPTERALTFCGRADGTQKLTYQIEMNRPLSLVWGASGKAILAFLPEREIAVTFEREGRSPATGAPLPSWSDLGRELAVIRERGWALSEGEKLAGARGIAAPVFGPTGVIGSICLTSPRDRLPEDMVERIGADVAAFAARLSQNLGGPQ